MIIKHQEKYSRPKYNPKNDNMQFKMIKNYKYIYLKMLAVYVQYKNRAYSNVKSQTFQKHWNCGLVGSN